MKNLFKIIPILLISLTTLQSCNNNDDENVQDVSTIVNLAVDSADLTSLVAALDRANLVSALNGEGPFTVLAPTNDAFAAFLSANNFNSLEEVPVDILTKYYLTM
jgi:Secreted and surface protein containing fasciclin-like repeats